MEEDYSDKKASELKDGVARPSSVIETIIHVTSTDFLARPTTKSMSSGSQKDLSLASESCLDNISKEKKDWKIFPSKSADIDEYDLDDISFKNNILPAHPKSAPVLRQPTVLDDENFNQISTAIRKSSFTKLDSKNGKKKRRKGIFGSMDGTSASTARDHGVSQSSSEIDSGFKVKKKKKKGKKHRSKSKKKKKSKVDSNILAILKSDKKSESETEIDESDNDDISNFQMRRRVYKPPGFPGQSFLRAQMEDPITLVEEEFLPQGLQSLRLTRSQLAMHFFFNKPRSAIRELKKKEKEPSEKSLHFSTVDDRKSKSPVDSVISQDVISSARSLAPSISPNFLKSAPLLPRYDCVRFTIPMDVRKLQKLTPWDYLLNYCIPASYFQSICIRVFEMNNGEEFSTIEFLERTFNEIFGYQISISHLQKAIELIGNSDEIKSNCKLFTACAALVMRILCSEMKSKLDKDKIEKMDFYLLRLNLRLFPIDPQTEQLLQFLDSI